MVDAYYRALPIGGTLEISLQEQSDSVTTIIYLSLAPNAKMCILRISCHCLYCGGAS